MKKFFAHVGWVSPTGGIERLQFNDRAQALGAIEELESRGITGVVVCSDADIGQDLERARNLKLFEKTSSGWRRMYATERTVYDQIKTALDQRDEQYKKMREAWEANVSSSAQVFQTPIFEDNGEKKPEGRPLQRIENLDRNSKNKIEEFKTLQKMPVIGHTHEKGTWKRAGQEVTFKITYQKPHIK